MKHISNIQGQKFNIINQLGYNVEKAFFLDGTTIQQFENYLLLGSSHHDVNTMTQFNFVEYLIFCVENKINSYGHVKNGQLTEKSKTELINNYKNSLTIIKEDWWNGKQSGVNLTFQIDGSDITFITSEMDLSHFKRQIMSSTDFSDNSGYQLNSNGIEYAEVGFNGRNGVKTTQTSIETIETTQPIKTNDVKQMETNSDFSHLKFGIEFRRGEGFFKTETDNLYFFMCWFETEIEQKTELSLLCSLYSKYKHENSISNEYEEDVWNKVFGDIGLDYDMV